MGKYIDCKDCQEQYDCERTYLGGCTDGKKWEEKKLTDEQLIHNLEEFAKDIDMNETGIYTDILNLIHRLLNEVSQWKSKAEHIEEVYNADREHFIKTTTEQKAEIERLTSLYDGKGGFMTSGIGDLPLTVDGLRRAVDEISRLLIVQGELQELNANYYNEAKDLRRENAELQKQVDELMRDKGFLIADLTNARQAVKDAAKEIFERVFGYMGSQQQFCIVNEEHKTLIDCDKLFDFVGKLAKEKGVELE